ncbi:MAG: carbohydrate kinase family protein [Acidimicrobiia bacterium]|jgi:pseudouridine kinase|nr:carbohydrate kinase family protein [Acidimicrobiia bacterium]
MKVACIGAAHVDVKARLVGETRSGTSNPARVVRTPGGVAGNVARNLGRLGLPVSLFSIIGDDAAGRTLLGELHAASVDTAGVLRSAGPPTASYLAVLDRDGRLIVAAADMEVYEALDPSWADGVGRSLGGFDAWVVDANLPGPTLSRLMPYAGKALVLADPVSVPKAGRLTAVLGRLDAVFPDRAEALVLAGFSPGADASVAAAAAAIRRRGPQAVIVSLGSRGAYLDEAAGPRQIPPLGTRAVVDVTGAGDAQIAGYLYGLSRPGGTRHPMEWGMAAASLTVETIDSVRADLTPTLLRDRLEGRTP